MLLALDVGNTNTSIGVFEGAELRCELRLSTARSWTRDEVAVAISQTLGLHGLSFSDVQDAVVASVVPPALSPLVAALRHYARCEPLVVGPGIKTGMPIRYDPPQDVGADRIVSAVAAHHRYARIDDDEPVGIIVVDFGTATTFDVVSPKPEYLGGAIAPGIAIGADALFSRAARLPRVEISRPPQAIGKNTVHALQSGLLYGYVALVEGMIARVGRETTWKNVVVATGGLAPLVARETRAIDVVDDNLMLDGLRIIHDRNRPAGHAPGGPRVSAADGEPAGSS
jgi:type III pantothenate kinase